MSEALDLFVDAVAATRLTRLVVEDTFPPVAAVRDAFVDKHTRRVPTVQPGVDPANVEREFRLGPHSVASLKSFGPLDVIMADVAAGRAWLHHSDAGDVEVLMADDPPSWQADRAQRVLDAGVVIGSEDEADSWAELVRCPWCAGFWVCLLVVFMRWRFPRAWRPLAKALAFSMGVGLVESKVDVE